MNIIVRRRPVRRGNKETFTISRTHHSVSVSRITARRAKYMARLLGEEIGRHVSLREFLDIIVEDLWKKEGFKQEP